MTLQCVIMFSICLPSCPQYCSLSWACLHHSSPLTGVTISHVSKPFSQCILISSTFYASLFFFYPRLPLSLPLHLISLFFSHSTPRLHFHPLILWISLSSPSHFPLPAFMSPILLYLSVCFIQLFFSCFMPHLTCVCPLFLLCFSYFPLPFIAPLSTQLAILTSSHHIYCIFLSFRLPSLPLVLPLLCLFLTSVFQAHCLFSVLSETVVQAVQGSYQPQ